MKTRKPKVHARLAGQKAAEAACFQRIRDQAKQTINAAGRMQWWPQRSGPTPQKTFTDPFQNGLISWFAIAKWSDRPSKGVRKLAGRSPHLEGRSPHFEILLQGPAMLSRGTPERAARFLLHEMAHVRGLDLPPRQLKNACSRGGRLRSTARSTGRPLPTLLPRESPCVTPERALRRLAGALQGGIQCIGHG